MSDIDDTPATGPLPPDLRFLKILVAVLTGTMIVGLITIVALLVIRLQAPANRAVPLPDQIALPVGVAASAVTMGPDWVAVVTEAGDEILIFDAEGVLIQRVEIMRP